MARRFEIITKEDARAAALAREHGLEKLIIADVYLVEGFDGCDHVIRRALRNPVSQVCAQVEGAIPNSVDVSFKPGVTDNEGNTATKLLRALTGQDGRVYSGKRYSVDQHKDIPEDVLRAFGEAVANPLIQRIDVSERVNTSPPTVRLENRAMWQTVELNISDDELVLLGKLGIEDFVLDARRGPLSLDLASLLAIRDYFDGLLRQPTDVELESIAQTWSEHCKHTILNAELDDVKEGLFRQYIKRATDEIAAKRTDDFLVSVFTDNSGIIRFDDQHDITVKVETHNSPSALDPYGGAGTGIVGVDRDAIGAGLGARPFFHIYGFCFGDPEDSRPLFRDAERTRKALPPRRIWRGVIDGVRDGGNQSGIPTPQGFVRVDDGYRGKPLVYVGVLGVAPREVAGRQFHEKKANPGDYVVMLGGRVGVDGIHGATFSSEALQAHSPATAVQIMDAITQKRLSDALMEIRDRGWYSSITDNGAGGLSCSIGEMAKESNGCRVELDKVPLKYVGMQAWEIWVSESQERMTLAVPKDAWEEFAEFMQRRDVEATVIGEFTDSGKCVVEYKGSTVMDVGLDFLHDGLPKKVLESRERVTDITPFVYTRPGGTEALTQVLGRYNVCNMSFIAEQFDHEVQGGSVIKPLQGLGRVQGHATVSRPVLSSEKGVVVSQALHPEYGEASTYHMAAASIDAAVRHAIAAGGSLDKLVLLDNFCWCDSLDEYRLDQLKLAAQACYDLSTAYGVPFVSGKDSMFNSFKGFDEHGPVTIDIQPTLLITAVGVVDDVSKCVSIDAKCAGDVVYVINPTYGDLGCSEYQRWIREREGVDHKYQSAPMISPDDSLGAMQALSRAIAEELVASAIAVDIGGLGVALAKTAMAGQYGLDVDLLACSHDKEYALFSETPGRFVVTVNPAVAEDFEQVMDGRARLVGAINPDDRVIIRVKDDPCVDTTLSVLQDAYNRLGDGV